MLYSYTPVPVPPVTLLHSQAVRPCITVKWTEDGGWREPSEPTNTHEVGFFKKEYSKERYRIVNTFARFLEYQKTTVSNSPRFYFL